MTHDRGAGSVTAVSDWQLTLDRDRVWTWAVARQAEIDQFFAKRKAANPALFNGRVLMGADWRITGTVVEARLLATDFASFLFWREAGYPDRTVFDAFGSALVWSSDGCMLLAEAGGHTINAGRVYLPGGFIDERDTRPDDSIDLDASIRRELAEETGLAAPTVTQKAGGLAVHAGQMLALVAEFASPLDQNALADRVRAFLRREAEPELAGISFIDPMRQRPAKPMPDYMIALMRHLSAPSRPKSV